VGGSGVLTLGVGSGAVVLADRYSVDGEYSAGNGIWSGRDEVLGRQVALQQVVRPDAGPDHVARVVRAAQRATRFQHPRAVQVLDVVHDHLTGAHWLVTEPVEGITLDELVRSRGALTAHEAAALTAQAADALVAAHAAGIVHGEVRPANIFVDRLGVTKLAGFATMRLPSPAREHETDAGAYLCPEMLAGQPADEAGDVWSLAATVLFAISGRAPQDLDQITGALDGGPGPGAGPLAPLLAGTLTTEGGQRWRMPQVRDHLAASSSVVTQRMPILLSLPSSWQDDEVVATVATSPAARKRKGVLATPSRRVLVGLSIGLVVTLATGAAGLHPSLRSETTSATTMGPAHTVGSPRVDSAPSAYQTTTLRARSLTASRPTDRSTGSRVGASRTSPHTAHHRKKPHAKSGSGKAHKSHATSKRHSSRTPSGSSSRPHKAHRRPAHRQPPHHGHGSGPAKPARPAAHHPRPPAHPAPPKPSPPHHSNPPKPSPPHHSNPPKPPKPPKPPAPHPPAHPHH
jgi:eukaryotic-like serine/threonine-protein kinase